MNIWEVLLNKERKQKRDLSSLHSLAHRTHSVALSGEVGRRLKRGIRCCSQNEMLTVGAGPPS